MRNMQTSFEEVIVGINTALVKSVFLLFFSDKQLYRLSCE